jgi:hypothetical protein
MLSFARYRIKLQEDLKMAPGAPAPPKKVASLLPQFPNMMSQVRASAKQARGLFRHAAKLQSQARLAKQQAAAKA